MEAILANVFGNERSFGLRKFPKFALDVKLGAEIGRKFNPTKMGTGKKYALHETDSTRAASRAHQFEEILEKVEAAGGEIILDEDTPLYTDIGLDEHEIGTIRKVEFNLNGFDFQLIRKVETGRIVGEGRNKNVEPMDPPRVSVSMKKKKDSEDTWQVVDTDSMM